MTRPRLSLFLPRPTPFYRALLPQMLRGFEQAGFETAGATRLLDEAEMSEWCRTHRPDVVFEMNRTREEAPFLPRTVRHVSWVVDLLGRLEADIGGSDIVYFFDYWWDINRRAYAGLGDTLFDWLPPGSCIETYRPVPAAEEVDMSFFGHVVNPWTSSELERNVSRTHRPLQFQDLIAEYEPLRNARPDGDRIGPVIPGLSDYLAAPNAIIAHKRPLYVAPINTSQIVWDILNGIATRETGDTLVDDPVLAYDLLSRIPRLVRLDAMREAVASGCSTHFYGTENWTRWPDFRAHFKGYVTEPGELCRVIGRSRINLHEGIGMHFRAMDCMAAGGLLFWNRGKEGRNATTDIECNFVDGEHLVIYHPGELAEKARYFLARPRLTRRIRANAREEIARRHTWCHRGKKVLGDLRLLDG